ncbi:hypothetical protein B0T24DRAFT_672547 [Lasiosphaeria ovina]|uniref:Uncharacterized protein n=1 Tax=Lasiosphaeria ovina TaxID=92902 RepID=A0AAE0NJB2_9PEZI|nr:hypothetical protein B0T24DRAFT_672547 [Lasiosphaeria ovina]
MMLRTEPKNYGLRPTGVLMWLSLAARVWTVCLLIAVFTISWRFRSEVSDARDAGGAKVLPTLPQPPRPPQAKPPIPVMIIWIVGLSSASLVWSAIVSWSGHSQRFIWYLLTLAGESFLVVPWLLSAIIVHMPLKDKKCSTFGKANFQVKFALGFIPFGTFVVPGGGSSACDKTVGLYVLMYLVALGYLVGAMAVFWLWLDRNPAQNPTQGPQGQYQQQGYGPQQFIDNSTGGGRPQQPQQPQQPYFQGEKNMQGPPGPFQQGPPGPFEQPGPMQPAPLPLAMGRGLPARPGPRQGLPAGPRPQPPFLVAGFAAQESNGVPQAPEGPYTQPEYAEDASFAAAAVPAAAAAAAVPARGRFAPGPAPARQVDRGFAPAPAGRGFAPAAPAAGGFDEPGGGYNEPAYNEPAYNEPTYNEPASGGGGGGGGYGPPPPQPVGNPYAQPRGGNPYAPAPATRSQPRAAQFAAAAAGGAAVGGLAGAAAAGWQQDDGPPNGPPNQFGAGAQQPQGPLVGGRRRLITQAELDAERPPDDLELNPELDPELFPAALNTGQARGAGRNLTGGPNDAGMQPGDPRSIHPDDQEPIDGLGDEEMMGDEQNYDEWEDDEGEQGLDGENGEEGEEGEDGEKRPKREGDEDKSEYEDDAFESGAEGAVDAKGRRDSTLKVLGSSVPQKTYKAYTPTPGLTDRGASTPMNGAANNKYKSYYGIGDYYDQSPGQVPEDDRLRVNTGDQSPYSPGSHYSSVPVTPLPLNTSKNPGISGGKNTMTQQPNNDDTEKNSGQQKSGGWFGGFFGGGK